jgi:protein SCO1
MNISKAHVWFLGSAVVGLGVVLGTLLWVKLGPRHEYRFPDAPALEGLSDFGPVPDFSLTERNGKAVRLADLRGKIWIADFIYTSCTDTCPLQTAEMAKLQERWGKHGDFKLISFSVDPARDTPKALVSYAERFKADVDRWLFLTGDQQEISRVVQEGFHLSATPALKSAAGDTVILHSPRFVLIDRKSRIRAYYDSRDAAALQRLNQDLDTLLSNGKE